MQKYSISKLLREGFDTFGFDLDGTLYDEFEFIRQAYKEIAVFISGKSTANPCALSQYMYELWLEYGSSKTDIFQMAFLQCGLEPSHDDIQKCIWMFRKCDISLTLPSRSSYVLDLLKERGKGIFIVSDGNSELQRRKIEALNLRRWFVEDRIFISGDYGKVYQKPSISIADIIEKKIHLEKRKTVYFGDRQVDEKFAEGMGFRFLYAPCMQIMA